MRRWYERDHDDGSRSAPAAASVSSTFRDQDGDEPTVLVVEDADD
jgi:hypothetical protein